MLLTLRPIIIFNSNILLQLTGGKASGFCEANIHFAVVHVNQVDSGKQEEHILNDMATKLFVSG